MIRGVTRAPARPQQADDEAHLYVVSATNLLLPWEAVRRAKRPRQHRASCRLRQSRKARSSRLLQTGATDNELSGRPSVNSSRKANMWLRAATGESTASLDGGQATRKQADRRPLVPSTPRECGSEASKYQRRNGKRLGPAGSISGENEDSWTVPWRCHVHATPCEAGCCERTAGYDALWYKAERLQGPAHRAKRPIGRG